MTENVFSIGSVDNHEDWSFSLQQKNNRKICIVHLYIKIYSLTNSVGFIIWDFNINEVQIGIKDISIDLQMMYFENKIKKEIVFEILREITALVLGSNPLTFNKKINDIECYSSKFDINLINPKLVVDDFDKWDVALNIDQLLKYSLKKIDKI